MNGLDRYEIVRPLGRGGMGTVDLARDTVLDRLVAVKRLRAGFDDDEMRHRFAREARILAALQHPNVISVFDYFERDGDPCLVMEYLEGETLRSVIAESRPWTLGRKLEVMGHVAAGLESVHRAGIIHRDVKPANLMLTRDGTVKLLDFGVAKTSGTVLTSPRMQVGSPNYMSPEQIRGEPLDARSDVFALTAVLFELVAFVPPFPGDVPQALGGILHGQPARLSTLADDVPERLERLVERGLAKDREARIGTAAAFGRELAAIRDDLAMARTVRVSMPSGSLPLRSETEVVQQIEEPPAGQRWRLAIAAAVLAIGLAGAYAVLVSWPRESTPEPRSSAPSGPENPTAHPGPVQPSSGPAGVPGEGKTRPQGSGKRPETPNPGSVKPETPSSPQAPDPGAPSVNPEPPKSSAAPSSSAPSEVAPTPNPTVDQSEIREVLAAYQAAHNERQVPAIKSLYPNLSQADTVTLTRSFLDYVDYRYELSDIVVQTRGDTALASAQCTRRFTPLNGEPRIVTGRADFSLRRIGGAWVIATIVGDR
jgi:serine/threonine-protein kinase